MRPLPPHPLKRRIARGLAFVAAAAAMGLGLGPASAAPLPDSPVLDRDFADPDVVKVGGTYHAYATNGDGKHIQHATSRDLKRWKADSRDVLPVLGGWAAPRRDLVWAPEVFATGDGFAMHYTAHDRASDRQCIGVALSSSPDGPFRPVGDGPLVCPAAEGGAIDASSYTEGGQRYLLWKNDGNCCGTDTWLHLQPVTWDGTRTTGDPVRLIRLIRQDPTGEDGVVEAPTLVKRAGQYVLFYSAGDYRGDHYRTGYAVARTLTGPYTKAAKPLMTTETLSGAVHGPGGQDVVTGPDGRDRIVFHGWLADPRRRVMYTAGLGFANGYPVVRGSKVLYQAENALVHHAAVRDAPSASDGRAVGGIGHADSHVEFTVFTAAAGEHRLSVWFGNGSQDGAGSPVEATHGLTVNGRTAGTVRYRHTGWDRWSVVDTALALKEGWNTIRLSKGEYYAELDGVEVA
ncbi:family 43 glycosylhydrolase [Streptomyces sp. NBC_00158]|uniref:family 43 glycosylhydrolase n=1 Tax=Streptomyces sp. NBC_00158 TaxID=2903627 RepID=UPI002F908A03